METFRIRLLSQEVSVLEGEVYCARAELWEYAAAFAKAGQPQDRLHMCDAQGETLTIMGAKLANALSQLIAAHAPHFEKQQRTPPP